MIKTMRVVISLFAAILLGLPGLALADNKPTQSAKRKSPTKTRTLDLCSKKDLDLKSCHLKMGSYQVRLSRDKVTVNDGTWKAVHDLPLVEEGVVWEKVGLRKLGSRWIVEIEFWSSPLGDAGIQDLKWFLFELNGSQWEKKVEEVIQKRRRRLQADGSMGSKKLYQMDRKAAYTLRLGPADKLNWMVGPLKGSF